MIRILLVEPNENWQQLWADVLSDFEMITTSTLNGAKVKLRESEKFDLIITELNLIADAIFPDKSGFLLIEQVQKFDEHVPIVVTTASSNVSDLRSLFAKHKVTDVLDKADRDLVIDIRKSIDSITSLRPLVYDEQEPPSELIRVVQTINVELLKNLKTRPQELYSLEPRQFEELIAEILASYGWQIRLTPSTKDGGYDLFAITKDISGITTSWIIECKRYAPHRKVGVDIVRALYGVKSNLRVANAMLATTSYFTRGVRDFKASRYDVELRDYEGILDWLNTYKPNPKGHLYIKDDRLRLPGEE